jgi:predicted ArsR family transcriptional regulator
LSVSIIVALTVDQRTAADLAVELAQPINDVVRQLSRLAAAGHVEVARLVTRPPAKRRVALYAVASPGAWPGPHAGLQRVFRTTL